MIYLDEIIQYNLQRKHDKITRISEKINYLMNEKRKCYELIEYYSNSKKYHSHRKTKEKLRDRIKSISNKLQC